jgi:glycosyltransferase involved in cell wall biosynthesis
MHLTVFSHKLCWKSDGSGYATDGGFPFQMKALAELFDTTSLVLPCSNERNRPGEIALVGPGLSLVPVTDPRGEGIRRKLRMPFWFLRNLPAMLREARRADVIHAPIPGDVGTFGMLLALALRKPLFVRHCGNWFVQTTVAERFWKWAMERLAGSGNLMLATGGAAHPPSDRNAAIGWIFSTTMSEEELDDYSLVREQPRSARLIIACRQEVKKGTGVLIESLPAILRSYPAATLDVVGEGGSLPHFKELAQSLGVSDRVTFHGRVDHHSVLKLMQQADLFCYPTQASEGFPKIVHEALACGLPVIATRVSVLPQLINGCGILIDQADPEEMARAVCACLDDPSLYQRMSAQAVETARNYSLEKWRDTIGGLLAASLRNCHA